jgi:hypothetical protein
MDIRNSRLGGAAEWLVAAAFLIATVIVAALIVREMRAVRTTPSSPAALPSSDEQHAPIPSGAIRVPSLLLSDGLQIKVGDTLERLASGSANRAMWERTWSKRGRSGTWSHAPAIMPARGS